MKKSQRLNTVTEVAAARENDAARKMGLKQQELHEKRLRLEELHSYRSDYSSKMLGEGKQGISAGQLHDYSNFIKRLDEAIIFQQRQIEIAIESVSVEKMNWQKMHTKTEALNKVTQRMRTEEINEINRKEQKESDDRAPRIIKNNY